jgi:phosphoketolase
MTLMTTSVMPSPAAAGNHSAAQSLTPDEPRIIHAYWRACNYLAAGMIYLHDNPLLREPRDAR